MAAVDIARRNRPGPGCFPIAGQRAGVFQPVQFLSPQIALAAAVAYLRLRFRVGKFLRLVLATLRSSFRLIACTSHETRLAVMTSTVSRAWPRALRQPPFVVSSI